MLELQGNKKKKQKTKKMGIFMQEYYRCPRKTEVGELTMISLRIKLSDLITAPLIQI